MIQTYIYKLFIYILLNVCCLGLFLLPCRAEGVRVFLPTPAEMLRPSGPFTPVLLKGVRVLAEDSLKLEFFVDAGDTTVNDLQLKAETDRLIRYFLAALTLPERDVWVNLSPYESTRIVPEALGRTQLGQDLLAQDYVLKQLSASLVHPDEEGGKNFWREVYRSAREFYGTSDIPVDTFNKVWVVPNTAGVYSADGGAYIVDSSLKVLGEEDYLALSQVGSSSDDRHERQLSMISGRALRTAILPLLDREVNSGREFAPLRQIYSAIILAVWFRRHLHQTFLGQSYADRGRVSGIEAADAAVKEKIYEQYLAAFREGVFDFVREEVDTDGSLVPRKYFSGGAEFGQVPLEDRAQAVFVETFHLRPGRLFRALVDLVAVPHRAVVVGPVFGRWQQEESLKRLSGTVLRAKDGREYRLGEIQLKKTVQGGTRFHFSLIDPETNEAFEDPIGFSGLVPGAGPLLRDLHWILQDRQAVETADTLVNRGLGTAFLRKLLLLDENMIVEAMIANTPTYDRIRAMAERGRIRNGKDLGHVFMGTVLGRVARAAGLEGDKIVLRYYGDPQRPDFYWEEDAAARRLTADIRQGIYYPLGYAMYAGNTPRGGSGFDAAQARNKKWDAQRFLQRLDNMTLREVDGLAYRLGRVRITPLSQEAYKFSYPVIDPRTGRAYEDPLGFSGVIEAGAAKVTDLDLRLQDQNAPATGSFLLGKGLGHAFRRELLSLHPRMVIEASIENVPTVAAIDTAIEQGLIRTAEDLKQVFFSAVLGKSVLASGVKPQEVVMTYYGVSYFRDGVLPENQQAVDQLLADRRAGRQFRVGYRIDRRLSHVASAADAAKGGVDFSSALVPLDVSGQKDSVLNQAEMAEFTEIEGLRPVILRMEKVDRPEIITRALGL